jgi:hypothetical protein
MRKFLDKFSLYWDFTNGAGSLGKAHPVKPVVRDLQGDFASVVRNTPKTSIQKNGSFGTVGANQLPYNWKTNRYGIYVTPSLQNLFRNSESATDPGQGTRTNLTFAVNDWGIGLDGKVVFVDSLVGRIYYNATIPSTGFYSASFIVKMDDLSVPIPGPSGGGSVDFRVLIGGTNSGTYQITPIGNGLYFVTYVVNVVSASFFNTNGIEKGVGYSSKGFSVSAIMLVSGSSPLTLEDYIKTTGSAQTRNADVITLSNIPDLIGQTQGFIYAEVNTRNLGTSRVFVNSVSSPTVNNSLRRIGILSDNTIYVQIGLSIINLGVGTVGINKIILQYTPSGFKGFLNGVPSSLNSATPSADIASVVNIGHNQTNEFHINDTIYRVGIGKEILSDEEAIFMTSYLDLDEMITLNNLQWDNEDEYYLFENKLKSILEP